MMTQQEHQKHLEELKTHTLTVRSMSEHLDHVSNRLQCVQQVQATVDRLMAFVVHNDCQLQMERNDKFHHFDWLKATHGDDKSVVWFYWRSGLFEAIEVDSMERLAWLKGRISVFEEWAEEIDWQNK